MTLIEQTYRQLAAVGLTTTEEEFSKEWVGRHKAWFAYQTHTQRDFSAASAIHCLRAIRQKLRRSDVLSTSQQRALRTSAARLLQHLNRAHFVAEVC